MDECEIVSSSSETTLFNNLARSFLCVPMMLGLYNLLRRVVAHSDKMAITSRKRMSLTGDDGLGIVSVKSNRLMFFNKLVGSV
jgi:hypothetical protein